MGEICIPEAEFISLYVESCSNTLTAKNIESGFRQTGLVPFNPAVALRKLPIIQLIQPDPIIPLHLQTLKNAHNLDQARDKLEPGDETPILVARKV